MKLSLRIIVIFPFFRWILCDLRYSRNHIIHVNAPKISSLSKTHKKVNNMVRPAAIVSKTTSNAFSPLITSHSQIYRGIPCKNNRVFLRMTGSFLLAVDGHWGNWGHYSACSKTCNEGVQQRIRFCDNPAPRNGGRYCKGSNVERSLCDKGRCILKEEDTEFRGGNAGIWSRYHTTTNNFEWKIHDNIHHRGNDATGDGYYISANAPHSAKAEDTAKIISHMIHASARHNRKCLKFRYNMHGSAAAYLSVRIRREKKNAPEIEILNIAGDRVGHNWIKAKTALRSSIPFQVIFAAVVGPLTSSNIALDNIYIDHGPCACQDNYESCEEWEKNGDCKSNYFWMSNECKKSCKTCYCSDELPRKKCRSWAIAGECKKNALYMSSKCQLSCGLCECFNRHPHCQIWSDHGQCNSNKNYMWKYCPLSCGTCSENTS